MVLFRILFNLLKLPLKLVFLPLRLLCLPVAIAMLPLRLLTRNMGLVLMLLAVIFIYRAFSHSNGPEMVQPAPSAPQANPAGAPGQIDDVQRRENGDSAFATDLYASMSKPERAYYSQMFFSVMSNVPDGASYPWMNGNIAGTLTPTRSFENNNGVSCRNFTEVLKVHQVEQTINGTACQRIEGGWCKLKLNATPACGLGNKGGGGILGAIGSLF